MKSAARRRAGGIVLTVVTALAAAAAAADDGAAARSGAKAAPKDAGHVELERLKRPAGPQAAPQADVVNAFASTSWYVPPPPPAPSAPPKPTAPPLPFTFMGRYDDAAKAVVMLVKGDRLYTVSVGDVIDGTYRVDRISDKSVELTYLPLQEKQALPTGGV